MCRVRAKILVARKLRARQKRKRRAVAPIFARPESSLARELARKRLLRRLNGTQFELPKNNLVATDKEIFSKAKVALPVLGFILVLSLNIPL